MEVTRTDLLITTEEGRETGVMLGLTLMLVELWTLGFGLLCER